MKALKLAGVVVAAAILPIVLVLTLGIPSGLLTFAIQPRVERATGYRMAIHGSSRIGLWPIFNLTLHDISLIHPAGTEHTEIASVRAAMPLAGLLFGRTTITELTVTRPVVHLPLLRERTPPPRTPPARTDAPPDQPSLFPIDRVTVTDGALVFSNPNDRVEDRIEAINATASVEANGQIAIAGDALSGAHPFNFKIRATAPDRATTGQNMPVELAFNAPDLLSETLSAKADVRINGRMLRINGVAGALGSKPFTGWASVDLASKPLVKVDLDMQDLAISAASPHPSATSSTTPAPWSEAAFDVTGLNYVDADIRISAAQLTLGHLRIAPAAMSATLSRGTLTTKFENLGLYDGLAHGTLTLDASGAIPTYDIHGDIDGVRALPMLSGLADFDRLEGKLQARFAVRTTGANQRALMSGLEGTAVVNFRDGKIRGLNVAQMIRSLTTGTLAGWQSDATQSTDLSQLSASFRIAQGKAATTDLALAGPLVRMSGAGTVDLAAKALALRVEPKLVMTLEGQGSTADPIGLGIPVVIDGPWTSPRIYPDVVGILDNPDAAYARLRELGKGLFGNSGRTEPADKTGNSLGETLGDMIRQGLGGIRRSPDPSDQPHDTNGPSPIDGILKQLFSR